MDPFGMCPSNNNEVLRWRAEKENAEARVQLALSKECCKLLMSQSDPVNSLGIDREALGVLLSFTQHHDTARLRREAEAYLNRHRAIP